MTLQRRVLAYLALAAVASCGLTVAVAIVLVRHRVAAQRDAVLVAQANFLAADGSLAPGTHVYRVAHGRAVRLGPVRSAAVLAQVPAGNGLGTITVGGRSLLFAARTTADGRVVLLRAAQLAFAEWRPFLWSVVVAGLGGALLALALSYVLARRLTRPIDQLSIATRRLAAGESAVAVPVAGEDELAQLGRSFNAMAAELSRTREAQRGFLESVSHELKTPLTAIRGYGEALEENAVSGAEAGSVIVAESERLARLVTDLLELARFGRADFTVARELVDLAGIARATVQRHAPRARELGVILSAETDADADADAADAVGLGDPQRLLQATSNLVENALRLTPAGGEVSVSAAHHQLTVRDTGPGLAADDLPHAFERFYLHRRYRSERGDGSGLGLAIVRELVEAMGGSVCASAALSGGAMFTLTLEVPTPARSAPSDAVRPSA